MIGRSLAALMAAALVSLPVVAKVPQEQAQRLLQPNGDLTPMGAQKSANKDGSIPAWNGGLTQGPPDWQGPGTRLTDPFPQEQAAFTITAAEADKYRDKLTVGQIALFHQYPQSYKMHVYPTHRTAGAPKFVYEATYRNATTAELGGNGEALQNAITGIPFPIPQSGFEVIWNHKTRYRGQGGTRWNVQAAVQDNGNFNLSKLREDFRIQYSTPNIKPEDLKNVLVFFLQVVTNPPRLAGTITLVHETMDQVKEPRRAWQYNPGQRRLRRAPNVGYDNPGTASDGLRTNDQYDSFNGAMDRYTWKLVGKREMYVPYNEYRLGSGKVRYEDILKAGHINQELPRYELHRVWVVESNLKPGTSHIYKRRTFYVDEDSWQIVAVDCYDKRDQLWRVQESHTLAVYDPGQVTQEASGAIGPVMEVIYDLNSRRYLAMSMNNQEQNTAEKVFNANYFEPANVAKLTIK
ncbi:MAG TPA: DUF1329 domain-containing protein [Candidatus Binatia bacterium]|nr:DUF1329 domain-containing protein [Candidatus Binatia bacterium]